MSMDKWSSGDTYEPFIGRWSRLVAQEFVAWLRVPAGRSWLDVGCGTGGLSRAILEFANPSAVKGIDRSDSYVAFAREAIRDPRASFEVGDAQALPVASSEYDTAVSGLVLNFVPQPEQMLAEMARAVRNAGMIALYVWDYAGRMELLRHFWDAAAALDPAARDLDEGPRFPICDPAELEKLFKQMGLTQVETRPIEVDTLFRDFDDFWSPFLGGQGPAPGYAMSLGEKQRAQLRERIRAGLPFAPDGSIPLVARAWAVKGTKT
ncbi:MAG TPA: class I SAM-dependent methyltransferase [Anaerolineales bacterium]|jgi:ubiquinone/menaquinone biosynthesis C-methylase UbiE